MTFGESETGWSTTKGTRTESDDVSKSFVTSREQASLRDGRSAHRPWEGCRVRPLEKWYPSARNAGPSISAAKRFRMIYMV